MELFLVEADRAKSPSHEIWNAVEKSGTGRKWEALYLSPPLPPAPGVFLLFWEKIAIKLLCLSRFYGQANSLAGWPHWHGGPPALARAQKCYHLLGRQYSTGPLQHHIWKLLWPIKSLVLSLPSEGKPTTWERIENVPEAPSWPSLHTGLQLSFCPLSTEERIFQECQGLRKWHLLMIHSPFPSHVLIPYSVFKVRFTGKIRDPVRSGALPKLIELVG